MNAIDVEKAEMLLTNPYWRINNLYSIVDKEGKKIPFRLNWAQEILYRDMWYCNVVLKARQLGISTFIGLLFLDRALFNSNVSCGIICESRESSEIFFKRIKLAYDCLPDEIKALRPANCDTRNELRFNNGSSILVGMQMRGSTIQYLHVSELGKIASRYPEKAREIISGSLNALAPGQYCFLESTAEGRDNVWFDMCKKAQDLRDSKKSLSKLDFKFHFFNWISHKEYRIDPSGTVLPVEFKEYFFKIEAQLKCTLDDGQKAWYYKMSERLKLDMKREFPSTPEESFESSTDGNYYSSYLTKARQENRITKLFYDPKKPCFSSWDLGFADSTSIWIFQLDGQRINLLEYFECSGEALPFYIKWLNSKPYTYEDHFVPHDSSQHEFSTGLTRTEVAAGLGVRFTQVASLKIDEGIDAVRNILHRCYFDEEKCSIGIKMLDAYRKDWNAQHGCWSTKPLHNFASHCADSFRILAIGLSQVENKGPDNTAKAVAAYFGQRY